MRTCIVWHCRRPECSLENINILGTTLSTKDLLLVYSSGIDKVVNGGPLSLTCSPQQICCSMRLWAAIHSLPALRCCQSQDIYYKEKKIDIGIIALNISKYLWSTGSNIIISCCFNGYSTDS